MTRESTPRWTPGSLADLIGRAWMPGAAAAGWLDGYAEADAVERLTRAAREVVDGNDTCMADAFRKLDDLRAAVEAAERWGR